MTTSVEPEHETLTSRPAALPGRYAVIDQLLADGLDVMFGNPGTVEQGILDVLGERPAMRYVLTLHESVAVMAADAYARARRKPALVQIHSSPGLGNAIGAIYQAMRGHSPLVILGGDAGIRYQAMDAQMAADLVAMAEPVTKWSTMVAHPSSLLRTIRRAVKIAATPPRGPVYVCLPMDVLDVPCEEAVTPASIPSTAVIPDSAFIEKAAAMLAAAERPMIFVGDGVAWSGAEHELVEVAELLGAEVWGVDSGELNISYAHPLYQGQTGHMFGWASREILAKGDVNLVVGTYIVPEVFPELGTVWGPGARTIHVDLNAYEIAKNHPVDLGIVADPRGTLDELAAELRRVTKRGQHEAAHDRAARIGAAKAERQRAEMEKDAAVARTEPIRFCCFMQELAPRLPAGTVLFDEALTNSPALTRYLPPSAPGTFFQTRGGSLGLALAGAIGLKLARPDAPVIAVSGDGGAMYTIQSIWTAVRHGLDVKYVICNNRSYRLLQANIGAWWKEQSITPHEFPLSFDLSNPPIRFDVLARGMGAEGERVETIAAIVPAIERMLASRGTFVLDLVLEGDVRPDHVGARCGQ